MTTIDYEIVDPLLTKVGLYSIMDFYQALSKHERQFSGATAFITGMNSTYFNVLFDTRVSSSDGSDDLIMAVQPYFDEHQLPWAWFIMPADKNNNLESFGFSLLDESPAMYYNLSGSIPEINADFLTIKEVRSDDDLSEWIKPINDGFQVKEGDDSFYRLTGDLEYTERQIVTIRVKY